METTTVGELLHWSHANLAIAHSAISAKTEKYGRLEFMIRSRLYAGLNKKTMTIGPLADDEPKIAKKPNKLVHGQGRQHVEW